MTDADAIGKAKRGSSRASTVVQAYFTYTENEEKVVIKGLTRDISATGLFLYITKLESVKIGQEVELILQMPQVSAAGGFKINVRIARIQKEAPLGLGMEFVDRTEAAVKNFVAHAQELVNQEKIQLAEEAKLRRNVKQSASQAKTVQTPAEVMRPVLDVCNQVFSQTFHRVFQVQSIGPETEDTPRGEITGSLRFSGSSKGLLCVSFPQATLFNLSAAFYNKKNATPPQMKQLVLDLVNSLGGQIQAVLKKIEIELNPENPDISMGQQRMVSLSDFPFSYTADSLIANMPIYISLFLSLNIRYKKDKNKDARAPVVVPRQFEVKEIIEALGNSAAADILERHNAKPRIRL